jgi:hypothetical protein
VALAHRAGKHDVLAALSIIVGLLLLAENLGLIGNVTSLWPLAVTLSGVALIIAGRNRGIYGRGSVGVGVYLLQTSFLFLYLNFTSWSSIAHMWPAFIGFLGISIFVSGRGGVRSGLLLYLCAFLVILSLLFFLIFTVDPKLWPISIILFGISLAFLGRERHDEEYRTD